MLFSGVLFKSPGAITNDTNTVYARVQAFSRIRRLMIQFWHRAIHSSVDLTVCIAVNKEKFDLDLSPTMNNIELVRVVFIHINAFKFHVPRSISFWVIVQKHAQAQKQRLWRVLYSCVLRTCNYNKHGHIHGTFCRKYKLNSYFWKPDKPGQTWTE